MAKPCLCPKKCQRLEWLAVQLRETSAEQKTKGCFSSTTVLHDLGLLLPRQPQLSWSCSASILDTAPLRFVSRDATEFTPFGGRSVCSGQASVLKHQPSDFLGSSVMRSLAARILLKRRCSCRTGNGESHKTWHHFKGLFLGNSKVWVGRLECFGAWLQWHCHGLLTKNPRLWLTGVGREVTHQVLCLSSFFYSLPNGVVRTCLQILLRWLPAHAVHSPSESIHCASHFYVPLFGLSNVSTTLTFWKILELWERTVLLKEPWFGCSSELSRLWWNARVWMKTSSEAATCRLCWFSSDFRMNYFFSLLFPDLFMLENVPNE